MGIFDVVNNNSHTNDVTTAKHTQLARELSAMSHVLLKNKDSLLPLDTTKPLKIALIGQAARSPIVGGGGSGQVVAKEVISPYKGILDALHITDSKPVIVKCLESNVLYNTSIDQNTCISQPTESLSDCANQCAENVNCRFYQFSMESKWCALYPTNFNMRSNPNYILGFCDKTEPTPNWQCNGDVCVATSDGNDVDVAAKLALEADVSIVFLASFAHEGADRENLSFDIQTDGTCQLSQAGQDSLVSVIAATKTKVIVAAVAPGAMLTPWRDEVHAILHGFMPGQE